MKSVCRVGGSVEGGGGEEGRRGCGGEVWRGGGCVEGRCGGGEGYGGKVWRECGGKEGACRRGVDVEGRRGHVGEE